MQIHSIAEPFCHKIIYALSWPEADTIHSLLFNPWSLDSGEEATTARLGFGAFSGKKEASMLVLIGEGCVSALAVESKVVLCCSPYPGERVIGQNVP